MLTLKVNMSAQPEDIYNQYDAHLERLNAMLASVGIVRRPPPGGVESPPPFPTEIYTLAPQQLSELQSLYQRWLEYYTTELAYARNSDRIGQSVLKAIESCVWLTMTGTEQTKKSKVKCDLRYINAQKRAMAAESKVYGLTTMVNMLDGHLKLLSRTISLKETELDHFRREQNVQNIRSIPQGGPYGLPGRVNSGQP